MPTFLIPAHDTIHDFIHLFMNETCAEDDWRFAIHTDFILLCISLVNCKPGFPGGLYFYAL